VDHRKREASAIIAAFDDAIAEAWGPERRRPFPKPMDLQTALDWIDAGATAALCRAVFAEVNARLADSGQEPPGTLKARDRDVRNAIAANATARPDDQHPDLFLDTGERVFGAALKRLPRPEADKLRAMARDASMSDLDRAREAKRMLAEAEKPGP
jgi:hypothetical protein